MKIGPGAEAGTDKLPLPTRTAQPWGGRCPLEGPKPCPGPKLPLHFGSRWWLQVSKIFKTKGLSWYMKIDFDESPQYSAVYLYASAHNKRVNFEFVLFNRDPSRSRLGPFPHRSTASPPGGFPHPPQLVPPLPTHAQLCLNLSPWPTGSNAVDVSSFIPLRPRRDETLHIDDWSLDFKGVPRCPPAPLCLPGPHRFRSEGRSRDTFRFLFCMFSTQFGTWWGGSESKKVKVPGTHPKQCRSQATTPCVQCAYSCAGQANGKFWATWVAAWI